MPSFRSLSKKQGTDAYISRSSAHTWDWQTSWYYLLIWNETCFSDSKIQCHCNENEIFGLQIFYLFCFACAAKWSCDVERSKSQNVHPRQVVGGICLQRQQTSAEVYQPNSTLYRIAKQKIRTASCWRKEHSFYFLGCYCHGLVYFYFMGLLRDESGEWSEKENGGTMKGSKVTKEKA